MKELKQHRSSDWVKEKEQIKNKVKLGLCSVRNKNIYHKSRLESISNLL